MLVKHLRLAAVFVALGWSMPLLVAQSAPVVDQGYAGATMVSGRATPGQAPVTIYDATTAARTALGASQSVDKMGNFAVVIRTPLIVGHSIIVVDHSGAASQPMVVTARPSSSSHQ